MNFNQIQKALSFSFLLVVAAISGCKKDSPVLTGNASVSNFTYEVVRHPGGDTLPFTNSVAFANTSNGAFTYLWDFGDANSSVLANPVHSFTGGTSFKVKLTSVGSKGNNVSQQTISMESPCDYVPFTTLTGCSNRKWSVSPFAEAIKILNAADSVLSTISGPTCLLDDQYTFNIAGALNYDAKGQTFVAGGGCQATRPNASQYFMMRGSATSNPRIVLAQGLLTTNPFLGTTDAVVGNSYEILSITEDDLLLQGLLSDGRKLQIKFVNASISVNSIRLFLTGGTRKTWKLDPAPGANPIVAGTEAAPTQYYAGGALVPAQVNDWYTFTSTDSLYVNFNGDALIYGGPGDYNPGPYDNFSGAYALGPITGSGAGSAQLVLGNSSQFIGVMDRVQNLYRILEVSSTSLRIRIGDGTNTVQTLKFVAK